MPKKTENSSYDDREKLDSKTELEWRNLSDQVIQSRSSKKCSESNKIILTSVDKTPQSPASSVYRLWAADSLAMDGLYPEAIKAYDHCVNACQKVKSFLSNSNLASGALIHKAQSLISLDDSEGALEAYNDLISLGPKVKIASLEAGRIAERIGKYDLASSYYKKIACSSYSEKTNDPTQLALRALDRLKSEDITYCKSETELASILTCSIEDQDIGKLQELVSKTHFSIGPVGGHTGFEDFGLFEYFLKDLKKGGVRVKRMLLGSGEKRYIPTTDWKGKWFYGNVSLIITGAPSGWLWTGIAIHQPNEYWLEHWKPKKIETNDPLPFELRAPWPKDQCFTAGGLWEFVAEAAVVAATWPFGALVAEAYSASSCCGWGTRGYYYNTGPTHSGKDAFSIDFTRYRRFVPFDNESGGTPVLAAREGIISNVIAGFSSGNSSSDNRVEIEHADPDNPTDTTRFTSKYLHLEGKFKIPVSMGMPVRVGTRLGYMDDTGNSVLDHLHFSIHDRQLPHPDASEGRSVRPTPMSGYTLGDSDSNKCIESDNVEYKGTNQMIYPSSYAGQNWLITPAALAVNETPPSYIADQKWMLTMSGVAHLNLKGNGSEWLRETVSLSPDINSAMSYAVNKYNIPIPTSDRGHRLRFQVEQWVPHATLSSIYNKKHSVNSGFAVDVWRPNPFSTDTDIVTNASMSKLFEGIQVDVAVSDIDAHFYRISYHISLIGKIRFGQPIIID